MDLFVFQSIDCTLQGVIAGSKAFRKLMHSVWWADLDAAMEEPYETDGELSVSEENIKHTKSRMGK